MEYGTPYVGMARKKNGRRIKYVQNECSKVYYARSHKPLWAVPVILRCFHNQKD